MIIHTFAFLPSLLPCGVCKRIGREAENGKHCRAREAQMTVLELQSVFLTGHGDAIAVGVGDQQPPLQFINANAAGPWGQILKHSVLYGGIHSKYH